MCKHEKGGWCAYLGYIDYNKGSFLGENHLESFHLQVTCVSLLAWRDRSGDVQALRHTLVLNVQSINVAEE